MSAYKYSSPSNRMKARRMLASLLPEAKDRIGEINNFGTVDVPDMFLGILSRLTEANLEGVHIYPAPLGGWHADIAFKDMPPGIPQVVGTPKAMPCNSREDAVDHAVANLSVMLTAMRNRPSNAEARKDYAVFQYDSATIFVPIEIMSELKKALRGNKTAESKRETEMHVIEHLIEIGRKFRGPEGLTEDVYDALPIESQKEIVMVSAMALAVGYPRWPETAPMPPTKSMTRN